MIRERGENAGDFGGFIFRELDEAIVEIDGLERLDENSLAGGAGGVDYAWDGAAIGSADGNYEAVVAERDVIVAGLVAAGAENRFEGFLNFFAGLGAGGADAF